MSTKSPQPSPTATQEYEKEFEQIDLGPVHPNVTIKPISDEVSRHGVQNGTGRRIVTKEEAEGYTAYAYTTRLKWGILTVLWMAQIAMNMNGSLYANAQVSMANFFDVSIQTTTYGNMIFLMSYAFGCELWAPWSEELGRKWLMQASMALVILFTAVVPFSHNFTTVMALRFLTGLATAGGSLTLGVAADMYKPHQQQHAVAFVAWGSMLGSALPPIAGGFMEQHIGTVGWKWCFWLIALFGALVQLLHLFIVPETTYKTALNKYAKKRRESAEREGNESSDLHLYGPTEGISIRDRFVFQEFGQTVCRPFKFLFTEPIVYCLSALSACGDAIVFLFIEVFGHIYGEKFGFDKACTGLMFIPLALGYTIGYFIQLYFNRLGRMKRAANQNCQDAQYEGRMSVLVFTAGCLPLGLLIFAATANPSYGHLAWVGTAFGVLFIGIANYTIYASTIDYMVAAYGFYAASATGGNGFARDFLAGALTPAGGPWVKKMGPQKMCGILAGISALFCAICIAVRIYGAWLRRRSKYTVQEVDTVVQMD
ncbi:mfs multidrug [Diaporthe amygdali]|uniref:mfs multidrug n=1 Tax=Phomopsis amygdali TaxID=1214568 RepID=UPI0022FDBA20|nr:mfs multidrug [Diaporthe amygdali]KAJ0123268.1 mfs multidrug [Diaporthe amygdali]